MSASRGAPAVYLDHAATSPIRPVALAAFAEEAARLGNPSSLHDAGRAARRGVEESREQLAAALGARPTEVVWTSGGTEADNLAVKGLYWARTERAAARRRVLVSAVEHHAVLDPADWLGERAGAEVVRLPVDEVGRVRLDALTDELAAHGDRTALVSVMWANNEVGTVQPLREVVDLAHRYGVPVHADAVQAVGQLDVDFAASGLDAMTVSGHKAGGPVGVGALLVRREQAVTPLLHGGGQERGLRSGTLAAPLARACAGAVAEAVRERAPEATRVAGLRDALVTAALAAVPDAVVRGPWPGGAERLPGNALLTVPGCDSELLLFLLDERGIAASAGSACQAGVTQVSHVLLAMGVPAVEARGALRLTLGRTSTADDVDRLVAALPEVVARARAAGRS